MKSIVAAGAPQSNVDGIVENNVDNVGYEEKVDNVGDEDYCGAP